MEKQALLEKLAFEQFKTQSDFLADKIKSMITKQELADGFVFPNENEFCKILNVSRGTLRDAYKKLDTQGFIERTKHGTYVKGKDKIAKQGNFSATLELATMQEMAEFIVTFEPEVARLAAQKIDDDGIRKMEELLIACEECAHDNDLLNQANYKFHDFIRSQAKNSLITSVLSAYYDTFSSHVILTIYQLLRENADNFKENALLQHRELFAAFQQRNSEKVRSIVQAHLQADLKAYAELHDH